MEMCCMEKRAVCPQGKNMNTDPGTQIQGRRVGAMSTSAASKINSFLDLLYALKCCGVTANFSI